MIVAVFVVFLNAFADNRIYDVFINYIIIFMSDITCLLQNIESNARIAAGKLGDGG